MEALAWHHLVWLTSTGATSLDMARTASDFTKLGLPASDFTRCENWPPDRISRSWLPLSVARAAP